MFSTSIAVNEVEQDTKVTEKNSLLKITQSMIGSSRYGYNEKPQQ